jgi:RNA polymerase sigma-70 factor (ECF subfamily)
MPTDFEYIQMVRRGDPAGAEALFHRHADAIVRFSTRMLGSPADAEEVCQDVFLKMIDRAEQFDGRGPLVSWLLSIAANACRNRLRSRKVRSAFPLRDAAEVAAPDPSAIGSLIAHEEATQLREALSALTEEQREALVLARYHGLSYAEVARTLSTTEGAIKTRIFRALEVLRRVLSDAEPTSVGLERKGAPWTTAKR